VQVPYPPGSGKDIVKTNLSRISKEKRARVLGVEKEK